MEMSFERKTTERRGRLSSANFEETAKTLTKNEANTWQVSLDNCYSFGRNLIEWGEPAAKTQVEWIFPPYENDATFVIITNSGFNGDGDSIVPQAIDSKGGFTWTLAGVKIWLEHGIMPNFVADAYPKGLSEH